jgi:hypothetical protein
MKEAKHDFGGHKQKAMEAMRDAIQQIKEALHDVGDDWKDDWKPKDVKYGEGSYRHLRHCEKVLREAQDNLKEAKGIPEKHRERALKEIRRAHEQVEKCIEHAK